MLRVLRAHLWKEWREQRRALFVLVAVCALVPLAIAFAAGTIGPSSMPLAEWSALGSGLLAAAMLGSDLVPREVSRRAASGIGLHGRLDGALGASLIAKACVFVCAIAVLVGVGYGIGSLVDTARGVELTVATYGLDFDGMVVVALAVVPWIFAVSALVARGIWSVPMGLIGGLGAYGVAGVGGVLVESWPLATVILVCNALAAFGVAWAGHVRGHRAGPSPRTAALVGGTALAMVALPSAALGGSAVWSALSVDPTRNDFRIDWFAPIEGSSRLIVNGSRVVRHSSAQGTLFDSWHELHRAFEFDLETGEWTPLWDRDSECDPLSSASEEMGYRYFRRGSRKVLYDDGARIWDSRERRFLDKNEAKAFERSRSERANNWARLGRGMYEDLELPYDERTIVDPKSGHSIALADLMSETWRAKAVLVRDGSWVVTYGSGEAKLYDPSSGHLESAPRVAELLEWSLGIDRLLPDGRLIGRDGKHVVVFDPEAPFDLEVLRGFTFEHPERTYLSFFRDWQSLEGESAMRRLVDLYDGGSRAAVAMLDFESMELRAVILDDWPSWYGHWVSDDRAIVQVGVNRIVEIDFESCTTRTVFPRFDD